MIEEIYRARVDLDESISKTILRGVFATEDALAHRFEIDVVRAGAPVDITGSSVTGYFVRYTDRATVFIQGESKNGRACVTLPQACYSSQGQFSLVIKLSLSGAIHTIFYAEGAVSRASTDTIVDTEHIIPSLDELLAQIELMESGTAAANSAAQAANTAAGAAAQAATAASTAATAANTAADAAGTATQNANSAAQAANTATSSAVAAAGKIEGMTASAVSIDAGLQPTVSVTDDGEKKHISLGIPKGETGPQGAPGPEGPPGPKGDPGDGSGDVASVNNIEPDSGGNVTLTAQDVGAVSQPEGEDDGSTNVQKPHIPLNDENGQPFYPLTAASQVILQDGQRLEQNGKIIADEAEHAQDADTLGGKTPKYYLNHINLLDNPQFLVNQRKITNSSKSGAYIADRWIFYTSTGATLTNDGTGVSCANGSATIQQRFSQNTISQSAHTAYACLSDGTMITGTISTSTSGEYDYCNFSISDSKKVIWTALYEGVYTADNFPPYVPTPYTEEISKCQRYYRNETQAVTIGTQYASSKSFFILTFPAMRVVPTLTITAIDSQGWGDVSKDSYTHGWSGHSGNSYYCNFISSANTGDAGKAVLVKYTASADI